MEQIEAPANGNINLELDHISPIKLINTRRWSYLERMYDLTTREKQIAELICYGLRNEDIASKLRIAKATVKTHIRNIYRKTRVKSKIAMLLRFMADTDHIS